MSTAYHPQTDGQSECTMKTLEDMHSACTIIFEGNWDTHLPLVDFLTLANGYHQPAYKECVPFKALYGGGVTRKGVVVSELEEKQVIDNKPMEIMDSEVKKLKKRQISIVKVRWNSRRGPKSTWEREDEMKRAVTFLKWKFSVLALGLVQDVYFLPNEMNRNRLMRTNELHKFSDGTLNHVRTALNDID
ncbi:putative reverse transcriptase domain-containing protein [Tanacetum coccineum]